MDNGYSPKKVTKRNVEFMAALNRLRNNSDFKIVLEKINALCHHGKDISGDSEVEILKNVGRQHCANYLNDRIKLLEKGELEDGL